MGKTLEMAIAGLGLGSLAGAQYAAQDPTLACSALASTFRYPNVTIISTEHVLAGTNLTLDQSTPELQSCGTASQVAPVDICRVAFHVSTSNRSGIAAEAWLPSNWTGRYLSLGNGGLNGCIQYTNLAYGSESGFAAVGSNNGHNGTAGTAFYQNSDVVEDFAYRAVLTETIVGKALTEHFYAKHTTKSYYAGCSTGGRQGFKMVQDYPELFDGVLAGAPALAFNNLSSWSGRFFLLTGTPDAPTFLPPAKWALVHADILAQCDSLDGATDGIIEDPSLCTYKPVAIQCASSATNTSACLTPAQVSTVTQVFSPYYGEGGALVYPRMQPGSETVASAVYYAGRPFPYTADWFKYAILQDPNWDPTTLDSALVAQSAALNLFNIETWSGDLSAFRARGGKLLHYHGLMDGIISSDNSPRYYEHVATTMGLAPAELDSFYRFFRISGLGHCTGGDGAWQIGQGSGGESGAEKNVLQRIVEWVEKGDAFAPDTVTGVKYVGNNKTNGVDFERRHCKYPKRNRFVGGAASSKDKDAWECVV